MYGITLKGHWRRLTMRGLRNLGYSESVAVRKLLKVMAKTFIAIVKKKIRAGEYGPLLKSRWTMDSNGDRKYLRGHMTRRLKKGRRSLIETGQLLKGLGAWDMPSPLLNPQVFAGIHRGQRHMENPTNTFRTRGMESLYDLAVTLHEGKRINVTDKMRSHFRNHGFPLASDTKEIIIPARPFIGRPAQDPVVIAEMEAIFGIGFKQIRFSF